MPINPKHLAPFVAGEYFHVYNRTNGSHKLFREDKNYQFFLNKFDELLASALDPYAYCLLPSHFHYLVRIKELMEIQAFVNAMGKYRTIDVNKTVVKQFQTFFTSYTMAFNEFYDRQGSLFNHRFKRIWVESEEQLKQRVFYIHSNPVRHGLTKNFFEYPWSSYSLILSDKPTKLKNEELIALFGGKEEFIKYHKERQPAIARVRPFKKDNY